MEYLCLFTKEFGRFVNILKLFFCKQLLFDLNFSIFSFLFIEIFDFSFFCFLTSIDFRSHVKILLLFNELLFENILLLLFLFLFLLLLFKVDLR